MMQRNRFVKVVLHVVFCISLSCTAQTFVVPGYNDYIKTVLENNPLSRRALNENLYGRYQLRAARGNYDPMLAGSLEQKQFDGRNYFTVLNAEVKQPIYTNQYLKFGYEYGVGPNVNPETVTPVQGLPFLGLEVGVLQGLVIDKRRAEVLKAKEYLQYYDQEQKMQVNELLYRSSQAYFEWLYSAKQIALNQYFLEAARKRLQGIGALADIGERAAVDTVEAAILYQTRLLELQSARIDNQRYGNGLSVFVWQNESPLSGVSGFTPTDSLDVYFEKAKEVLRVNSDLTAMQNPVIGKYEAFQKVLGIDLRLKKEMIKPALNIKYNFLASDNLTSSSLVFNNSYKWGLNLSFPLFLRNPYNEYKMTGVLVNNNKLELDNKRNELNVKLNLIQQNLFLLSEQLLNAQRTVNYSRLLLEAEQLKFNNGESSLFMLNTRENRLLETELKLAEYKFKFISTVMTLTYLSGSLDYKL